MLIEQTHFPHKGTNWGAIALITGVVIVAAVIIYNAPARPKVSFWYKPEENKSADDKTTEEKL